MVEVVPIQMKYSWAYLLKGERPILVDTGSANEETKILNTLSAHHINPTDIALILHTHGHTDHCGSTAALKEITQAPVAIHQMDHFMMQSGRNGPLYPTRLIARLLKFFLPSLRCEGLTADILIKDEGSLKPYGVSAEYIFTPGHTVGSISIITDTGEAIIGDLLVGGPFLGLFRPHVPRYHYYAYDITVINWSIRKLLKHNPTRLYVGHGGPFDGDTIRTWFQNKSWS